MKDQEEIKIKKNGSRAIVKSGEIFKTNEVARTNKLGLEMLSKNKFQEASALFEKLEQLHGADHGDSRVFKDIRMNLSIHRHLFDR